MTGFISPFTDFGFKRLFGEEPNKDLLIDFLNQLLFKELEENEIVDLSYTQTERLGISVIDRKAIFDLYCTTSSGEKIIVELQKAKQKFFKDRSVFYSTFPIQEQALKGNWNFRLKAVYTIGILDFVFETDSDDIVHIENKYLHNVKLTDQETNQVFYDKLSFIYIEMPKFNKTIDQLETKFDKWLYILKNLEELRQRPEKLQERVFKRLFEVAEIAAFTPQEAQSYQQSLKYYRDMNNVVDTAEEEGLARGMEKGMEKGIQKGMEQGIQKGELRSKFQIAQNLQDMNMPLEKVAQATGLTIDQLRQMIDE